MKPVVSRSTNRSPGFPDPGATAFRAAVVLLGMMVTSQAPIVSAQVPVRIEGVECDECSLSIARMARLGNIEDLHAPADRPHRGVVRDSQGRFFVRGGYPITDILVYGPEGELLEVRGRRGEGPGEFRSIEQFLFLEDDTLGVVDVVQRRLTVMAPDGTVARTLRFPVEPREVVHMGRDVFVVAGLEYTSGGLGYPTHVVYPDGRTRRLEGEVPVLQTRPSASQRRLAGGHDFVWSGRPDRYEIARWGLDGRVTMLIDRVAEWFPDRETEGAVNTAVESPAPFLMDLHVDEDGRLWTLSRVAALTWAPVEDGGPSSRLSRFDFVVEVIDPERQALLVSERFHGYPHGFTNDGLIVTEVEGPFDLTVLEIWEPTLGVI